MLSESTSAWKRYGPAVAAVALALVVRLLLGSVLGSKIPYITFFPAIIFSALYAGYRSGLLAVVLAVAVLWFDPVGTFNISDSADQIGLVLFIGISLLIIWLSENVRRTTLQATLAEQRSTTILESISDAFFSVDSDWRFTYINSKAEEFFGKPRNEMLGRNLWETFPAARGSVFDERYHQAMERKVALSFEARSTINQKWLGVNAYPSTEGLSVFSRDITIRKQTENELDKLLHREQEARQAAETANRLKDEFLATISHELRTPLTAILGWAGMAQSADFPPEKIRGMLEVIERNARTQNKIIDDILDVSRIITGKLHLQMSRVKIVPIVRAALEAIGPAASVRQIEILTDFADGQDVVVQGDPDRLQQIIWNLLSNAVKFTPEDGRIEVRLRKRDNYLEISVRDSGEGIEKEFLPFVFDRFRQADGGTNRKHGGLGLGLAIVRHLTELQGGTVSVISDGKGTGAVFTVRLPIAAIETGSAANLPADQSGPRVAERRMTGKRILIVDDEPDARELTSFILSECGAEVATAESAVRALEQIKENPPDIMISDIGMPEIDGFDLIQRIKELPQAKDLKTIALTAYARQEDKEKALAAGYHSYLPKPVRPLDLIEKVNELLDGESTH
jgi:PAS domain S-box-containing protein